MPSQLHEALVFLFRNRPALAPKLLQEAPVYVANLRARLKAEVCLLVVTPDEKTARWAARPIRLGGANVFVPVVLGPSAVPIVTEPGRAKDDPELAVLSAMAHGRDPDFTRAAQIAAVAQDAILGLDEERARLYVDLVLASLSEAARRELHAMDPAKYEYQSEFAKRYIALGRVEGKAEGKAEGKVDLLVRLLRARFGTVPDDALSRLRSASIDELDAIGERIVTARTLGEALDPT